MRRIGSRFLAHRSFASLHSFSTATCPAVELSVAPRVPFDETNLLLKHEAHWQKIQSEKYDSLGFSSGIRRSMHAQSTTIRECNFMIRRPALQIINALKHTKPDLPVMRYILYGRYGCGKTVSLHHVIYWAHLNNWMICSFPRSFTYHRFDIESIQSTWNPARLDLPQEAALWLGHFKKSNLTLLQNPEFVASKDYNWAPGEVTKAGQPLLDIITMGTSRLKTASDCMAALLKELKDYANQKRIKLLVAIDMVNTFTQPTQQHSRTSKHAAEPDDVTIMRAMRKMLKFDWNNGACVLTIDSFVKREHLPTGPDTSHLPHFLLGKEGMNYLEPFLPVEVPVYSYKEASSCINYYAEKKWLVSKQAQTEEGRSELFRMCLFNPLMLEQICGEH